MSVFRALRLVLTTSFHFVLFAVLFFGTVNLFASQKSINLQENIKKEHYSKEYKSVSITQLFKNFYKTKRVGLHFYRSFVGAIAMWAIFVGLRNLELAEVTSIAFSGPIWVVIFSILFLSEKIKAKRWTAVGLGFIGVIIISKPGFDNLNYYYIYPVIFTLAFAGVSIFIRKLTLVGEPIYLIAFYFSVCSGIFGLCTLPFGGWLMPSSYDLGLLILIGLFGSTANLLLTKSYQLAEVSLTTPLKYLSLVFAIIFGFYMIYKGYWFITDPNATFHDCCKTR